MLARYGCVLPLATTASLPSLLPLSLPSTQGAFSRAHEASLCVYDDPPNSITYPCGNM
jgi:hypothetical protein